jgi:hypothetical protein
MTRQAGDAKDTDGLEAGGNRNPQREGMAWVTMLAWIAFAFLVAGLVAYRLVTPFFH